MGAGYSITTRSDGETLTAAKYNADRQLFVDNSVPLLFDDYSTNLAQFQAQTDPGESGSESLPTTLAGELDRLRYRLAEITGSTYWYQTGTGIRAQSLAAASFPSAGTLGRIGYESDGIRGLYVDQGTQWVHLGGSIANVKMFGALGAGGSDDTTAIQAALAAANVVYFPPGTYQITSALTVSNKSVKLIGAGRNISIIRQVTAGANGLTYSSTADTDTLEVTGLTFQAGVAAAGTAIAASYTAVASSVYDRVRIHNCAFLWQTAGSHYWTNGIQFTDVWNSHVDHNLFGLKPPVGQTFNAGAGVKLLGESNDCTISSNRFYHCQYGVSVGGTTEGVTVFDNAMVSVDIGVICSTAAAEPGKSVAYNHINAYSAGISLDARTDTDVSYNLVYKHTSSTQNFSGIILQNTATGSDWARIIGNKIAGVGAGGSEDGIVLGRATYCVVMGNLSDGLGSLIWLQANASLNTVTGNRSSNTVTACITIDSSAVNNIIYDNYPQVNSGVTALTNNSTTPAVDKSENGHFIASNTAGTAITNFTNGYDGQVISVRTTEANTQFNNGATLSMQGAANYGPANGAILTFRRDGGVWYEIGRRTP